MFGTDRPDEELFRSVDPANCGPDAVPAVRGVGVLHATVPGGGTRCLRGLGRLRRLNPGHRGAVDRAGDRSRPTAHTANPTRVNTASMMPTHSQNRPPAVGSRNG